MALNVNYKYKGQVPEMSQRRMEGLKVKRRYPGKIPLVIGKVKNSNLPDMAKCKFLFPATATVGDLCHYINVKLNRSEEAPMFIYAQNELIVSKGSIIAGVYQEYREDDFFLYLAYYEENAYSDLSRSES